MKTMIATAGLVATALLVSLTATPSAQAQTPPAAASCKAQATEKKLHGAALTSFMKKCETDAQAACDASATERKLAGAAKTSFTKKCVGDAVGQ
ncbi:PsiF family protein [Rhodoplanes sp. SY1]